MGGTLNRGAIALAIVAALTAAVVTRWLTPAPPAGPARIITDTLFMEHARPDLVRPSIGEKLTTKKVRGQTTIADAPSAPGRRSVATYCAPLRTNLHQGDADSARGIPTVTNRTAVLPDFGGRRAGARLELYSTLNDERRWSWTGTARGRVTWASSGDSVLVRGDRLWIRAIRGAPRCAAWGAAGGAIGALAGQDGRQLGVTALVSALACAF